MAHWTAPNDSPYWQGLDRLADKLLANRARAHGASLEAGQSKPLHVFFGVVGGAITIDPAPDAEMEEMK